MKVTIPARASAPETQLFVRILKQPSDRQKDWNRDVMILVPGGPGGNHTLYAELEDELLKYADLVIVDLRGCGYSDKSDVKFCTLTHHIDDLAVVIDALGIKQPIMHGCSYGAMVALGYAISYPETLSQLILTSAAASGEYIEEAKQSLLTRGTAAQIAMGEVLWSGAFKSPEQFAQFYKVMLPLYVYHLDSPDTTSKQAPTAAIPYNIELVNYAYPGFLRAFDFRDSLHKVRVPTLIFSGKNDWITDPKQAELLVKNIPKSHLVSIDECGHFPWKDQRELFFSHLIKFLATQAPLDEKDMKDQVSLACSSSNK